MSGRIFYCPNWQLVHRTGSHPVTITVKTLMEHLWEPLIRLMPPKMPRYILSLSLTHDHCYVAFFILKHSFPCPLLTSTCYCPTNWQTWLKNNCHNNVLLADHLIAICPAWLSDIQDTNSVKDCSESHGQFPSLLLLLTNKMSK